MLPPWPQSGLVLLPLLLGQFSDIRFDPFLRKHKVKLLGYKTEVKQVMVGEMV
jgi:hypothetical protein